MINMLIYINDIYDDYIHNTITLYNEIKSEHTKLF